MGGWASLTRDITQNRQEDIDKEIGTAAALEKDADGREEDGEDDFADVAILPFIMLVCV